MGWTRHMDRVTRSSAGMQRSYGRSRARQQTPRQSHCETTSYAPLTNAASVATVDTVPAPGDAVVVECFEQGGRVHVRVVSEGYEPGWNVQFPRAIRRPAYAMWWTPCTPARVVSTGRAGRSGACCDAGPPHRWTIERATACVAGCRMICVICMWIPPSPSGMSGREAGLAMRPTWDMAQSGEVLAHTCFPLMKKLVRTEASCTGPMLWSWPGVLDGAHLVRGRATPGAAL
jgi:hypothetical protein